MSNEVALLELEHVSKTYPGVEHSLDVQVLRDVSLSVISGDCLSIMGPSGCGKSTLLHIMGSLDRPSSGRVRLQRRDLAEATDRELAEVRNRTVGFVFQDHHLLPQCTLLENVLVPVLASKRTTRASEERALNLLRRVGLQDRLHHRPGELSGGECQRVAAVRALINRPALMLADEPTGALDGATADGLVDLLLELNREEKVALVVVTHSPAVAERAPRRFLLDKGCLSPIDRQAAHRESPA